MTLYLLNDDDVAFIRNLKQAMQGTVGKRFVNVSPRPYPGLDTGEPTPNVYLAWINTAIPPIGSGNIGTGTGTGSINEHAHAVECPIFRLDPTTGILDDQQFTVPLYNGAALAVGTNQFVQAVMDKWGVWWAVPFAATGGGGGTGSLTVTQVNGSGTTTNVSTLKFDQVQGFATSTLSAGVAEVSAVAASPTQTGVVTSATDAGGLQTLTSKKFQKFIWVDNTGESSPGDFEVFPGVSIGSSITASLSSDPVVAIYPYFISGRLYTGGAGPGSEGGFELWFLHTSNTTRFVVCSNTSGSACFSIRDSSGTYFNGATGTSGGGDTVKGGIITTLGSSTVTLTINSTAISGGTHYGLLFDTSTDKLGCSGTITTDGSNNLNVSTNLILADGANISISTSGTGSTIGGSASALIGFWGATPVVQYSTTGTTTGFTAGAGTTVDSAATFTGGLGFTAYTIGDVVLALKKAGIMAS